MNWKQGLDRYLTNPPDDPYTDWYEAAMNCFSDDFYNQNNVWLESKDCDEILCRIFNEGCAPEEASEIIEKLIS